MRIDWFDIDYSMTYEEWTQNKTEILDMINLLEELLDEVEDE